MSLLGRRAGEGVLDEAAHRQGSEKVEVRAEPADQRTEDAVVDAGHRKAVDAPAPVAHGAAAHSRRVEVAEDVAPDASGPVADEPLLEREVTDGDVGLNAAGHRLPPRHLGRAVLCGHRLHAGADRDREDEQDGQRLGNVSNLHTNRSSQDDRVRARAFPAAPRTSA